MARRTWPALVVMALLLGGLAPAISVARPEPETRLYIGHSARLVAEIPAGWTIDATDNFDYAGDNGFIRTRPIPGETLDSACSGLAESGLFAAVAGPAEATWRGSDACRLDGRIEEFDVAALVIPHPFPYEIWGERYSFVTIMTAPDDLSAIAATIDFSPERVTPQAYYESVIELLEAHSYWSGEIDWELARREIFASIEGLPTLALAQGALLMLMQKLFFAGDNHSYSIPAGTGNPFAEASGYGFLVGGTQIVLVFSNGPADRAGLRVGDRIVAVEGVPLEPVTWPSDPYRVINRRSVELTVRRPGVETPLTFVVEYAVYDRYAPPWGGRLPGEPGIGYIAIPHFSSPGREIEFAEAGNQIVAAADQPAACGWVVDLRLNQGGAYHPMVAAVGSILGDGTFTSWLWRDGRQSWISLDDGVIFDDGVNVGDYSGVMYELQSGLPPVAVLTSWATGSSGEVTTLAFVGRPNTRLFGETTYGATTPIRGFSLYDGAMLGLAIAAMTDRTGTIHLDGVAPDEEIAIDWATFGTDEDPVLRAAVEWLREQPACGATPGATPVATPQTD